MSQIMIKIFDQQIVPHKKAPSPHGFKNSIRELKKKKSYSKFFMSVFSLHYQNSKKTGKERKKIIEQALNKPDAEILSKISENYKSLYIYLYILTYMFICVTYNVHKITYIYEIH